MTYPGEQPPRPTPAGSAPQFPGAEPDGSTIHSGQSGHSGNSGPVRGRDLLRACWNLLKSDRSLLLLPVLSAAAGAVALAVFFVPAVLVAWADGTEGAAQGWIYAGGIVGGFAAGVIAIFFQAALVFGANERADGGDPTVRSTLTAALGRIRPILGWAVLTTVVGSLIRLIERRAGFLGGIIGFLGGLAWAVATFLAVPVVVAENVTPVEAVKRSSALITSTWGLGLRSTLRWGLIQLALLVPPALLVFLGFVLVSRDTTATVALGVALAAIGLVALVVLGIAFAAVGQYARAMLYRYATGRAVPGLDPRLLAGAFVPAKRLA
jgi:hypothetical protein